MLSAAERREALKDEFTRCRSCVRCPQLAATRTTVVYGAGNADADLMFIGEAPGANEDRQGLPFVGQAGGLLDRLLGEVGLSRSDVFICNTLKCRPPGNRDPQPAEIENCRGWLLRQIELVEPRVICTLGNFATKLVRGDPTGITRLHGRDEVRVIGTRAVRLLPLLHPAAALYTRSMADTLRADFSRVPELLALPLPEQPGAAAAGQQHEDEGALGAEVRPPVALVPARAGAGEHRAEPRGGERSGPAPEQGQGARRPAPGPEACEPSGPAPEPGADASSEPAPEPEAGEPSEHAAGAPAVEQIALF